jgi:hypothetical protein
VLATTRPIASGLKVILPASGGVGKSTIAP